MLSSTRLKQGVIVLLFIASRPVCAGDLLAGARVKTGMHFYSLKNSPSRPRLFTPKYADFSIRDANGKPLPNRVGLIYLREKVDGDRVLVSARCEGLKGWAAARELVPLTEAESFFSEEIVRNPRNSFAFLMRGTVRYEDDDTDRALADLDDSVRLDPKDANALMRRATVWIIKKDPAKALADLKTALVLDPKNSSVIACRGMIYYGLNEYEKALLDFDQAAQLGSTSIMIHTGRGWVYLSRREFDKASEAFARALEIDPESTEALIGRCGVQILESRADDAFATLDNLIRIDPKCAIAYDLRGSLFSMLCRDDRAIAEFDEAIKLDPQVAQYLYNRGRMRAERGEFDRALTDIDASIRLDPNDDQSQGARAWILATCPVSRIRNGAQAVVSANRACELTKWSDPYCLVVLAAAYSEIGDFASAVKWQENAIASLDLGNSDFKACRAILGYYKRKTPYHSVGSFQRIALRKQ